MRQEGSNLNRHDVVGTVACTLTDACKCADVDVPSRGVAKAQNFQMALWGVLFV
jgi:hypothetical protein